MIIRPSREIFPSIQAVQKMTFRGSIPFRLFRGEILAIIGTSLKKILKTTKQQSIRGDRLADISNPVFPKAVFPNQGLLVLTFSIILAGAILVVDALSQIRCMYCLKLHLLLIIIPKH